MTSKKTKREPCEQAGRGGVEVDSGARGMDIGLQQPHLSDRLGMPFINSALAGILTLLPKWAARPFASPYVAGTTFAQALEVVNRLNSNGFSATLGGDNKKGRPDERVNSKRAPLTSARSKIPQSAARDLRYHNVLKMF